MSRKRIYNRVMDDSNRMCPLDELLTDKELEFIRLHSPREDWPNTAKVTVKTGEIYFSFMTCCRLNLSGLQENRLIDMLLRWV